MADKLEIRNPSVGSDIKVSIQSPEFDEESQLTGGWNPPLGESAILPSQVGFIMTHPQRRIVLETLSHEDLLIGVTNSSVTNTLKILSATKKGGASPVGFIAPRKNGIAADGLNVVLNAKQSIIVQMMPQ